MLPPLTLLILSFLAAAAPLGVHEVDLSPDRVQQALAGDFDLLLEDATAQVPAGTTRVVLYGRDAVGERVPLEDLLPGGPPVPRKDAPGGPPVDHPGAADGGLSGRAIYVSQCHGWKYVSGQFYLQRPNLFDTVEDLHNPEATNQVLVRYLENAGAAVFTAKERDHNPNMALSDNDGDGYSESGSGFVDGAAGFVDRTSWEHGENPFETGTTRRFPADGGAVATWIPEVPADGRYAVYVSWAWDSTHASDAHYRITHPGGVIDRRFDQRVHGATWQYVETLWLPAGVGGIQVDLIGDSSDAGSWLSADAVRIGGGMGSVSRGGSTTLRPRWESAAYLHTQYNGAPTSVYDFYSDGNGSDPGSRSRWARWEHPEGEDAVYVSWHSNAGGGRGTSTYTYTGNSGAAVTGSESLGSSIQSNIVDAMRALYDSGWTDRGNLQAAFAEVSPYHNPETPSALIEMAFHDEATDVEYLKDPEFRADASRAIYRGIVDYFSDRDGGTPVYLPEPPEDVALVHGAGGRLEVSFTAGPTGFPFGDAPSEYVLFASADGHSWDNGATISGSGAEVTAAPGETIFVRVAARNSGGISFPSEVVGARQSPDGAATVLVVAAFDRMETSLLPWEAIGGTVGDVRRMDLPRVNPYDIVAAHGRAIGGAGWPFDSMADERLAETDLSAYRLVVWAAGEESTWDETFSATQQTQIMTFVQQGGALVVSGAEVLWDLDERGSEGDRAFASDVLGATMASDDANTTVVTGEDLLAGLDLGFSEDQGAPYPVEYPDVLESTKGVIARYDGGGVAAILGDSVALFGFPLETMASEADRLEVFSRLLPILVPDYTPPEDTGFTDTGEVDTGGETGKPRACGCASGALPGSQGWLALLALGWLRVRSAPRRDIL